MKKLLSVMLSAVIILSSLSALSVTSAFAEGEGTIYYDTEFMQEHGDVVEAFIEGIENYTSRINLSSFKISSDYVAKIYAAAMYTRPDLFYLGTNYSYSRDGNNILTAISPRYSYSADELDEKKASFEQSAEQYLSRVDSSMSDIEKALILHDELAINNTYVLNTDVYNLMVEGRGKCFGYAGAYAYLLKRVGINSEQVLSDAMNHQWNKVQIDGKWYHVDVTWDDPLVNREGYVKHTYFLLSDTAFPIDEETGEIDHYDYVSDFESTDTRFDNSVLKNAEFARLAYVGGKYYMVDAENREISTYDFVTDSTETFKKINDRWDAGDGYVWIQPFTGVDGYDDYLYYNTPSAIYAYDTLSGSETLFYENTEENEIYGLRIIENRVYAAIAEDPNVARTLVSAGECLVHNDVYTTEDGKKISLDAEFTRDAEDTADFGIGNVFKNSQLLGVQRKYSDAATDDEAERSIRFIAVLNNDVLSDSEDYGFIAVGSDNKENARDIIGDLTLDTAPKSNIFTCKGSDNKVSGDYGKYSSDKSYKYITFAINNVGDYGAAVVFYLKDKSGNVFYAPYIDSEGVTYTNCAVDWNSIT